MQNLQQIRELSYGARSPGNALVLGDNVEVLERIGEQVRGRIRCIYIDPPYNNNERYTHYDDRTGHEEWLEQIETVLGLLHPLLREDGSLWISIDDTQVHYLKVLADGIFGRDNFITTIIWEHRKSRENRRVFSNNHEYVLVFARHAAAFKKTRNRVPPDAEILSRYDNPDDDPRGPWQSVSANVQAGHGTPSQFYELVAPNGRRHRPPKGRCWAYTQEKMAEAIAAGDIWFGKDGNGVPRFKRFFDKAQTGVTPETLWTADSVGTTRLAKRQLLELFPNDAVFDTPKPEQLVAQILTIATDPGDLVLDAYLGSGTTAAVAHKMGRRWIGIEVGDHAVTHCVHRLQKVVDGETGGISKHVGWSGGGGFTFHQVQLDELAEAA